MSRIKADATTGRISLLAEARSTVNKLLDRVSVVGLTLGLITIIVSIVRMKSEGLHPNVVAALVVYPTVVLVILLRNRMPGTVALSLLVGIVTVSALINFVTLGLASVSFLILSTCAILTLTVFGRRPGFIYLAGSIPAVALVWLARSRGLVPAWELSPGYLDTASTWLMQMSTYVVFTVIILVTADSVQVRLGAVLDRQARQADELREREEKYRLLAENMQDVVFVQGMDMRFTYANPAAKRMFGYDPEEVYDLTMDRLMDPESLKCALGRFNEVVGKIRAGEDADLPEMEFNYIRKDGSTFAGACRPNLIRDADGNLAGLQGIMVDITERRKADLALRAALEEKDVLLRELYHRTKNNMQVIHSMLSLQAATTSDPAVLDMFKDIQGRIQAMSLVHQKLYTSKTLSHINLAEYVGELFILLGRGYRDRAARTTLSLDIAPLPMSVDTAVPCGLVLNELITNSFKYAFPDGRNGVVSVAAHRDDAGSVTLMYADDGAGVPPGFDFRAAGTLGMQVVHGIVEHQLQGSIAFRTGNGLACTIRFRDNQYGERV